MSNFYRHLNQKHISKEENEDSNQKVHCGKATSSLLDKWVVRSSECIIPLSESCEDQGESVQDMLEDILFCSSNEDTIPVAVTDEPVKTTEEILIIGDEVEVSGDPALLVELDQCPEVLTLENVLLKKQIESKNEKTTLRPSKKRGKRLIKGKKLC